MAFPGSHGVRTCDVLLRETDPEEAKLGGLGETEEANGLARVGGERYLGLALEFLSNSIIMLLASPGREGQSRARQRKMRWVGCVENLMNSPKLFSIHLLGFR